MDAIGYARISIEDQSQNSLPGQVAEITSYCQRNKLNLHKIFIDNGQSAFNFQRKEWKEVEIYLKHNKQIKYLVITAMDRFSRANLVDALQKLNEIQNRTGVKVITVSDPLNIDIEDFGTDLRRIMELMFSNYELKKIRKRTSDGMYHALASGRWVNKAPYGYVNVRDESGKPVLSIDEEKAFIVRMIFRSYLRGSQIEEIRKIAIANGIKLKGNSTIRRILSNPLYAGLISLPKHGQYLSRIVKAIHAPLISESDYWIVQQRLNQKTRAVRNNNDMFLKGILHCECGQKMSSDRTRGKYNYYLYYLCPKHRKNLSAMKLHKQIDEILDILSLDEESIKQVNDRLKSMIDQREGTRTGDLMRAKLNLSKIQDRISATQERYLTQPDISEKVYQKVISVLKLDEQRLLGQISDLGGSGKNYHVIDEILPKLSNLKTIFKDLPQHRKTAFLQFAFGNFIIYKDNIFRTSYLNFLFSGNELILKEKRLLFVLQSLDTFGITPGSSPSGSLLEHLKGLADILAA